MQNEKKRNLIIIGLISVIVLLVIILILSLTEVFNFKRETINNDNAENNNTQNEEHVDWVEYLLKNDIQDITITRSRNKLFGDSEDYNKTVTLTIDELKKSLKKIDNSNLTKMYLAGLGGPSKDELKISYLLDGKEYSFVIVFGTIILTNNMDEGLLSVLNDSSDKSTYNDLLKENPELDDDYIFTFEENPFYIFDEYFEENDNLVEDNQTDKEENKEISNDSKKENLGDENDKVENNNANSAEYASWMEYILKQDITNIDIFRSRYAENPDDVYTAKVNINVEQLKNIFTKLGKYTLEKTYSHGGGFTYGDVLTISYSIDGVNYDVRITNGLYWDDESIRDDKLSSAFENSATVVGVYLEGAYSIYIFKGYDGSIFDEYFE